MNPHGTNAGVIYSSVSLDIAFDICAFNNFGKANKLLISDMICIVVLANSF